jgi:hypothetical protein
MTTNVPVPAFGPTGFVSPPESAILAGVLADLQAAFGGNLNENLETPQGQLASSLTAIIGDFYDLFTFYTQQVDPAFASGRMQDAIARIYFLTRKPAQATVVQALCTGLVNTPIPTGSIAKATDGNLYVCTTGGLIPSGGSITLPFACATAGPIPCPANSLSRIYQAIPGWDTINNPADGVIGENIETREDFEFRREESVAVNSVGAIGAVIGAVAAVPGVLDFFGYNNGTGSPVTIGGVTIPAHAIFISVEGGADLDVAQAILLKKAPGCATYGNTAVTAFDANPLYTSPVPYTINFERPTPTPILFAVTLQNNANVPATAQTLVTNAIIAAFSGADGGSRARIGSTLFASRYYAPIAALGSWVNIVSILIGSPVSPGASFTASIAGTVMTVTAVASGALAVGQTVLGAGVSPGTIIASLGSGSGGTGTYNLSLSQTVSSEAMTSVLPALNSLTVGIDQVPTINAADVSLALV